MSSVIPDTSSENMTHIEQASASQVGIAAQGARTWWSTGRQADVLLHSCYRQEQKREYYGQTQGHDEDAALQVQGQLLLTTGGRGSPEHRTAQPKSGAWALEETKWAQCVVGVLSLLQQKNKTHRALKPVRAVAEKS